MVLFLVSGADVLDIFKVSSLLRRMGPLLVQNTTPVEFSQLRGGSTRKFHYLFNQVVNTLLINKKYSKIVQVLLQLI
jgi:hypothetical protein